MVPLLPLLLPESYQGNLKPGEKIRGGETYSNLYHTLVRFL